MDVARKGLKWVAVQTGQTTEARSRTADFVNCARTWGVRVGLWSQPPRTSQVVQALKDTGASFYIANIEGPDDLVGFDPALFRQSFPDMEAAVCTTFGGFEYDREKARPYIEAGFNCQGEVYLNENANAMPAALNQRARGLGWPGCSSLLGLYKGALGRKSLADYRDVVAPRPWGIYLLETMTEDDWRELALWTS